MNIIVGFIQKIIWFIGKISSFFDILYQPPLHFTIKHCYFSQVLRGFYFLIMLSIISLI
jgi:hypothetical protein